MSFARLIVALWALGVRSDARLVVHTARNGDTPESLAAEYYGNRALASLLREVNGIPHGAKLARGQKVRIPSAYRYRVRKGESLEVLAQRLLDDKRRAQYLGQWNGMHPGGQLREGSELLVPFQLVHKAAAPESLASLAKSFYGDSGQAKMLAGYNFRTTPMLGKGEKLLVPIAHVRIRAVRLSPPSKPTKKGEPPPDAAAREAELAQRVAARLEQSEKAYKEGNYNDVPTALTKLLSEEDPSEGQLVAIHRLLAFAYVALGAEEVAVKEFREVLERDPDAKLDAATVSPKIRAAFDRAKHDRDR